MDQFNQIMGEAAGQQPPEWIRVLPLGKVELSDHRESFQVDRASLEALVVAFQSRGIDLVVDYEHQSLAGERAPAAGWIKNLEARDDGLWARVDWTVQARDYLANREYRYFSPVLRLDPETRKPLALLHLGLTNVPAINHLPPLVAKAEAFADARAAQAARAKQYGIGVKDGGNVTKPGQWSQVPDSDWGDPVNYRYPMPDAAHARNALARWGDASNRAQYTEAEQNIIEKRIRSRAKALGVQSQEGSAMKEKLMKLLGLDSEPPEAEILALVDRRVKEAGVLTEIGAALDLKAEEISGAKIKGAILALKQGQDQLTSLQREVEALKAQNARDQAEKLVIQAMKEGKVLAAQREWALKYAGDDPEGFKTYVEKAPKLVPVGEEFRILPEGKDSQAGLTPAELATCKMLGVTPEVFKAEKNKQAAA
jgi:phage I-like protein